MQRIAILSNVPPNPTHLPGSPRLFSLLREWRKSYELCLFMDYPKSPIAPEVLELFSAVEYFDLPPMTPLLGKMSHRLHNAPYFSQRYRNPAFIKDAQEKCTEWCQRHGVTHVHAYRIGSVEYLPLEMPQTQLTIDFVDDISLLYLRDAKLEKDTLRRVDLNLEARAIGAWSQYYASRVNRVFVVSDADAAHLRRRWGIDSIVAPNGVDLEYFSDHYRNPKPERIVFTGVMNYAPNVETAEFLVQNVFPLIRKRCTSAEVYLVGANPCERVLALGAQPGVHVTGTVPDVRPYLNEATLFACPMHSGAGIKNKILAAMAMRIPVVATPLGIAGVKAESPTHCLLSENEDTFAEYVCEIIEGRRDTTAMVNAARTLVETEYSWPAAAAQIADYFSE